MSRVKTVKQPDNFTHQRETSRRRDKRKQRLVRVLRIRPALAGDERDAHHGRTGMPAAASAALASAMLC